MRPLRASVISSSSPEAIPALLQVPGHRRMPNDPSHLHQVTGFALLRSRSKRSTASITLTQAIVGRRFTAGGCASSTTTSTTARHRRPSSKAVIEGPSSQASRSCSIGGGLAPTRWPGDYPDPPPDGRLQSGSPSIRGACSEPRTRISTASPSTLARAVSSATHRRRILSTPSRLTAVTGMPSSSLAEKPTRPRSAAPCSKIRAPTEMTGPADLAGYGMEG